MKMLGIVLIVLGVAGLAYGGFSWTQREKVVDIGSVEISADTHKSLPIPPIAGGVCLAAGVIVLVAGSRRA